MPNVKDLGTRFRTVKSAVGQLTFSANAVQSLELPRSFLYKTLYLRLAGSIANSASATFVSDEMPLDLIRKIEVLADGRKLLVVGSGRSLYRLAHFQRGVEPPRIGVNAVAAATYPIAALIPIDFQAVRMQMPADSFFDPRAYEKLELRITWGATTDLLTGGTVTTPTTPTLDVFIDQTTKGADLSGFNRLHIFDDVPLNATSTNLVLRVPRAGLLAHMMLGSLGGSAGKTIATGVINFVTLRSDSNFVHVDRLKFDTDLLQLGTVDTLANMRFNPDLSVAVSGGVAAPAMQGWGFIDLTEDGMIGSALNTVDLQTLDLVLDVTGAASNHVIIEYVFYEPIQN